MPLATIRFEFGGRKASATLDGHPPRWACDDDDRPEVKEYIEGVLNCFHDPVKDYGGPADGAFGVRTAHEAAARFGGEAEVTELPEGDKETVY